MSATISWRIAHYSHRDSQVPPSAAALSKLLLTLYAAPLQPALWPKFLDDLSRELGLAGAAIAHHDVAAEKVEFNASVGLAAESMKLYAAHYGHFDPWRPKLICKAEGELVSCDELLATRDLKRTGFYVDYLRHHGITLSCAVNTLKRPDRIEVMSFHRHLDADIESPETIAAIEMLVPHMQAALQLRRQLCDAEKTANNYLEILESLGAGVLLLNERGECNFVSRNAEQLCMEGNGIYIRQRRIGAHQPEDHQALCRLIERTTLMATGKSFLPCAAISVRRKKAAPLKVSAVALTPQAPLSLLPSWRSASVAVFIGIPGDHVEALPTILIATYGLTSAEARVAAHLFEGCSLSQAAERNNVSRHTVRVQLRSIFNKCQVRRQADLLRLCSQLVRGF